MKPFEVRPTPMTELLEGCWGPWSQADGSTLQSIDCPPHIKHRIRRTWPKLCEVKGHLFIFAEIVFMDSRPPLAPGLCTCLGSSPHNFPRSPDCETKLESKKDKLKLFYASAANPAFVSLTSVSNNCNDDRWDIAVFEDFQCKLPWWTLPITESICCNFISLESMNSHARCHEQMAESWHHSPCHLQM